MGLVPSKLLSQDRLCDLSREGWGLGVRVVRRVPEGSLRPSCPAGWLVACRLARPDLRRGRGSLGDPWPAGQVEKQVVGLSRTVGSLHDACRSRRAKRSDGFYVDQPKWIIVSPGWVARQDARRSSRPGSSPGCVGSLDRLSEEGRSRVPGAVCGSGCHSLLGCRPRSTVRR